MDRMIHPTKLSEGLRADRFFRKSLLRREKNLAISVTIIFFAVLISSSHSKTPQTQKNKSGSILQLAEVESYPSGFWRPGLAKAAHILDSQAKNISEIAFSKDNRYLVAGVAEYSSSGSADGSVILWEVASWKKIDEIKTGFPVYSLSCSTTDYVAVAGYGNDICIINLKNRAKFRLKGHFGSIYSLAFTPDGLKLASGGEDGKVRIWDIEKRKIIDEFKPDNESIFALEYSRDGRILAVRTQGETVLLRNQKTGKDILRLKEQGLNVETLAFSPDNKSFATNLAHESIVVRDCLTGKITKKFPAKSAEVDWCVDNNYLLVGDGNRITIFNPTTGTHIISFRAHDYWVKGLACSNDNKYIASVGYHSMLVVWDVTSLEKLKKSTQPQIPEVATINGRYSELARIIPAKEKQKTLGLLYEEGFRKESSYPEIGKVPDGYWIYNSPNWYVFSKSRIGLYKPPKKMPEPYLAPSGRRFVWLGVPGVT